MNTGWLIGDSGALTDDLLRALDAISDLAASEAATQAPDPGRALRVPPGLRVRNWRVHRQPGAPEPRSVRGAAAVVYLAGARSKRRLPDLADFEGVVASARAAEAEHLVVVGSTVVFAPSPHHPGLVEDGALELARNHHPVAQAWRDLESAANRGDSLPGGGLRRTLLRVPSVHSGVRGRGYWNPGIGTLLGGRIAWVPLGLDPPMQWISTAQLAQGISHCLGQRREGTRHLVSLGQTTRLRPTLRRLGIYRVPVPSFALKIVARFVPKFGAVDYRRYPFTVAEGLPGSTVAVDPSPKAEVDDPFGQSKRYIDRLGRTLFRALHDLYWRVELQGLEHVPREGGAVLVGMHRGFQPWDGVMTTHALATRRGRYPRFLIHPTLVKFPFLEPYMRRLGGLLANQPNADWVLSRGELLGVYPEGIRGAFRPYRRAYRLGRLGRGEFVSMAIRHQVPIVPFVTVGSAEIFPILARIRWPAFSRYTLWPYFPITTPLPLPSKWHTQFLEPVETAGRYSVDRAHDRSTVQEVHDLVVARMRRSMEDQLRRRPSAFWGNLRAPESRAAETEG